MKKPTPEASAAAAALARLSRTNPTPAQVAASQANGRKGGRPPRIVLHVPDRAASEWEEHFTLSGKTIAPKNVTLDQFGGTLEHAGYRYTADQEALHGYPNPGAYYFTRAAPTTDH